MSSIMVLVVLASALFSGPTAFLMLWLTYRKTKEGTLRTLAFCMMALFLILVGNTASFILDNFIGNHDPRISFVLMNGIFLATVMTGAFLLRFAAESTGTKDTPVRRGIFWTFTVLFFFLVISLPIFLPGNGDVDVRHGYLASTFYGTLCQAAACVLIVAKRERLPPIYRKILPAVFVALFFLGCISVMNDAFHLGSKILGLDVPFSPLFFIIMNTVIVILCLKALLSHHESMQESACGVESEIPDFGLSGREREIFPLLLAGLSNDDIADKLFISPHTVKNHVTSIFRKACVANRFELLKIVKLRGQSS